jgi:hypothetical protein
MKSSWEMDEGQLRSDIQRAYQMRLREIHDAERVFASRMADYHTQWIKKLNRNPAEWPTFLSDTLGIPITSQGEVKDVEPTGSA